MHGNLEIENIMTIYIFKNMLSIFVNFKLVYLNILLV